MLAVAYLLKSFEGLNLNISGLLKCGESYVYEDLEYFGDVDLTSSLERLRRKDDTKLLADLLDCGLRLFKQFPCNHLAASLVCKRLIAIIRVLIDTLCHPVQKAGPSSDSILPEPEIAIARLEELLSDTIRFFCRFSRQDFRMFQLIGNEPDDILTHFHSQFPTLLSHIASAGGNSSHSYNLRHVEDYFFICNELPSIRKQVFVDRIVDTYALLVSNSRTDSEVKSQQKTEIKKELESIRDFVKNCAEETLRLVDSDHCLITQKAFRAVWLKRPKRRLCILLKDFIDDVKHRLTSESHHNKEVNHALKVLIAVLNNNSPMMPSDTISEFVLAKVTRAVPEGEMSLLNAIHSIDTCIMAPSLAMQGKIIFSDDLSELTLTQAISSTGWTSITGPTLSGKSCRLRHVVGTISRRELTDIPATIDVVWIDFDGVHNEIDGVLRIASQLYFRRCYTLTALEAKLKDLLSRLKKNSIVVFDNIVFNKKASSVHTALTSESYVAFRSPPDHSTVAIDKESNPLSHLSNWNRFIVHLCSICHDFNHISFVIVSDSCFSLESTITFKEKLVVLPVRKEVANDTAKEMEKAIIANSKCTINAPIDIKSLVAGSERLTGMMESIARFPWSLSNFREFSNQICAAGEDLEAIKTARINAITTMFHSLNRESKLLACTLPWHDGHFSLRSIWSITKDIYSGDIIKFRIAWEGLVDAGWIVESSELGWRLSKLAALVQPSHTAIDGQFLYDNYVLFWASELARINEAGAQSPNALDEFGRYSTHFRHVFDNLLSYHAITNEAMVHNLEVNKRLLKTRTHNALESLNSENHKQSQSVHRSPSLHLVAQMSLALSRKISSQFASDTRDNDSVSEDSSHDDSSATTAKQDALNKRRVSLAHAPNTRFSSPKPTLVDKANAISGNDTSEWNCVDARNIRPISVVSPMIIEKILEIVGGKLGRILTYHIPPVIALKIAQQIMCNLTPMDGIHYDASVVDFAEQCLRNNLVSEGMSYLIQITTLFFSQLDGDVHDPPYFAARALLTLGHLQLVETSYSSAQLAFDAADRILSLEGWNAAEHHELRVIRNYRWEATSKLATIKSGTTVASDAKHDNDTNNTVKQKWKGVSKVFQAVGIAKKKEKEPIRKPVSK